MHAHFQHQAAREVHENPSSRQSEKEQATAKAHAATQASSAKPSRKSPKEARAKTEALKKAIAQKNLAHAAATGASIKHGGKEYVRTEKLESTLHPVNNLTSIPR